MIAVFTHGRVYMPTNISTEVMIGHQLKHFYTKSIAYMCFFFKPTKNSRLTTFPLAVGEFAFLVPRFFSECHKCVFRSMEATDNLTVVTFLSIYRR